jgi:hypothetical protein
VPTPEGELEFTSTGHMQNGLLRFRERHELRGRAETVVREHHTTMRPWKRSELTRRLLDTGLADIEVRDGLGRRTNDRLLCIARH